MKYCSNCGQPVSLQPVEGDERERFVCNACNTIHYENPKVVAGCLPIWEDKVLLCRRAIEPRSGLWNVPAGYLENGETIEEGAIREVWEEACAKVSVVGLQTIYNITRINQVYLLYVAELIEPTFSCGIESLEVKLFSEADIPWDEMAFTSSTFCLKHYFEDRKKGLLQLHTASYPTVF